MSLDSIIRGVSSGTGAEVNSANELKTTGGSASKANAGYNVCIFENSDTTYFATAYRESPLVTGDKRLAVGMDTPLFDYTFNGTIANSSVWKTAFTTQTITAASGFLNLNANSTTTTTTYCFYQTWRHFAIRGHGAMHINISLQTSATMPANQTFEAGLFLGQANAAPTDGVFFRWTSAGLAGGVAFNGVETMTSVFSFTPTAGVSFQLHIVVYENEVEFWAQVQGVGEKLLGELAVPNANGQPFMTTALPLCLQNRNSGTVTGPAIIKVSDCHIDYRDAAYKKNYADQQSGMGMIASQLPDGSTIPTTGAKTSIWANNTAPTAVALTNTTAAFTGLGGIAAVLPTLAVNSDGIVFSYQNPAGSVNQTPRALHITGVKVQGGVSVVFAGGPVLYAYALAYGHSAVSLATAETASFATATTKAPRIIPIGMETYAATAAVGSLGTGASMTFATPIVVNPGEFIAIVARNLGVVTTTGAITIVASFDGYWE